MYSKVSHQTGATRHAVARPTEAEIEERAEFRPAESLEIWPDEQGVLLIRFDRQQEFAGDTWHASIEEAKAQALQEFHVGADDWVIE